MMEVGRCSARAVEKTGCVYGKFGRWGWWGGWRCFLARDGGGGDTPLLTDWEAALMRKIRKGPYFTKSLCKRVNGMFQKWAGLQVALHSLTENAVIRLYPNPTSSPWDCWTYRFLMTPRVCVNPRVGTWAPYSQRHSSREAPHPSRRLPSRPGCFQPAALCFLLWSFSRG